VQTLLLPHQTNFKSVAIHIATTGSSENVKSFLAKTSPPGLNEKKWLVLIRPSLAGFESTADTFEDAGKQLCIIRETNLR
jgi:hypothetical protein